MRVQVSEPYSSMGNTHVEYMRSVVEILPCENMSITLNILISWNGN